MADQGDDVNEGAVWSSMYPKLKCQCNDANGLTSPPRPLVGFESPHQGCICVLGRQTHEHLRESHYDRMTDSKDFFIRESVLNNKIIQNNLDITQILASPDKCIFFL